VSNRKAQYERQFKKWGARKNLRETEWKFIHHRTQKRKREGKESVAYVDDILVPPKKLKKEVSRHCPPTFAQGYVSGSCCPSLDIWRVSSLLTHFEAASPRTPEGISVCTPPQLVSCASQAFNPQVPGEAFPSIHTPSELTSCDRQIRSPQNLMDVSTSTHTVTFNLENLPWFRFLEFMDSQCASPLNIRFEY
jgi:hypothetical protein